MKKIELKELEKYEIETELKNHMLRVSGYAELLADLICLEAVKIREIKKGALLHDIGKKIIDGSILNKPSKLTLEEFAKIKQHTKLGLKVLNKCDAEDTVMNIILLHHEKWDGNGYPFGLERLSIPIEARIVSVADCYDALTSNRVYKSRMSHEKALEVLKNESGESFDPDIISMFEIFENKFRRLLEKYDETKR